MKIKWRRLNHKIHYWGSIICAIPVLIIVITGIILCLRKEIEWIQPKTIVGQGLVPTITISQIFDISKTVSIAEIESWKDIERLDIRPSRGIVKVLTNNQIEVQIDYQTREILQVATRRSGIIESIHEGTFFHKSVPFLIFLPSAIILLILLITGIYIFISSFPSKNPFKGIVANQPFR
jgi:uncharacterized iron-regulated membrane protein